MTLWPGCLTGANCGDDFQSTINPRQSRGLLAGGCKYLYGVPKAPASGSWWHSSVHLAYNYDAMGFYDRDYQRDDYEGRQPGFHLGGARTLTTNLVIVMFVIYGIQLATRGVRPDAGCVSPLRPLLKKA